MTYVASSTGRVVRAVLFDTFGTVVDWRSGISDAVQRFLDNTAARDHGLSADPDAFADAWRAQYQPAMERVRSGERPFVSLDVLHRENLDTVLRSFGSDPGAPGAPGAPGTPGTPGAPGAFAPGVLDTLARAWHFLPPWPDSVDGLGQVKRDFIIGPLSNGNTALLVDMAKFGGLPWDVVLGSDVTEAYKPTRDAYLKPAAFLGLEPGEVMLAAAHNGDLAAAREAGLATAFIARPTEHGPDQRQDLSATADWDVIAASITDLAGQLRHSR
jgi:2-haloacid dehalogenase